MSETERSAPENEFVPLIVVLDERLSRDRALWLTRLIGQFRSFTQVELVRSDTTDDQLRARLEQHPALKVLIPWDRLEKSTKLDFPNRVGGYSGETVAQQKLEEVLARGPTRLRTHCAFWDWSPTRQINALSPAVIGMRLWLKPAWASGLRGWLGDSVPIYVEHWNKGQGLGLRLDQIAQIPELKSATWQSRLGIVRNTLCALWSVVYEQGAGHTNPAFQGASGAVASLQIAVTESVLAIRVCTQAPGKNGTESLKGYFPGSDSDLNPKQLVSHAADFTRVQWIKDAGGIEITALFFAESEVNFHKARSFWIGDLNAQQVREDPFEAPSPERPMLKVLPPIALPSGAQAPRAVSSDADVLRELRKQLAEKDAQIAELRAGGVGVAKPLPPPDTEALIEAFQSRYFEAKLRIRELEVQVHDLETRGGKPGDVEQLRQRISAIANREKAWIQKIGSAIETARAAKSGGRRP